ncbi:MAG: AI-2E family transporter [Clostridiales bacterium]|nr:AI-2E family transporter [Clostridiales bacterium]
MKFTIDKKFLKYSLYASLAIIIPIIFFLFLYNIVPIYKFFMYLWDWIKMMLSPFIIGGLMAYILNPGARWFEENLYGKWKGKKKARKIDRILSIATIYLILASFLITVIIFIVPQVANNIVELSKVIPDYINTAIQWVEHWAEDIHIEDLYSFREDINRDIVSDIERYIINIFNTTGQVLDYILNNLLYNLLSNIINITSGLLNFILGIIISCYLLADKESIKISTEKLLRLIFNEKKADRIKNFGREADEIFGKFIVGKSLDSFIIGVMCFVGLKLMGIKYILLLSLIVGVTNMIPYFGPIIGAVPVVIITFFDSPMNALWVAIFIFVLQQFDGMILGPKILGDSVGIKPIWIILSIIIGGKLAGVLGMFLGVPICAIIRLMVIRFVDRQLEKKNINIPKNS